VSANIQAIVNRIVTNETFKTEIASTLAGDSVFQSSVALSIVENIVDNSTFIENIATAILSNTEVLHQIITSIINNEELIENIITNIVNNETLLENIVAHVMSSETLIQDIVNQVVQNEHFYEQIVENVLVNQTFINSVVNEIAGQETIIINIAEGILKEVAIYEKITELITSVAISLVDPDGNSIAANDNGQLIVQVATNEHFGIVKGQDNVSPATWHNVSADDGLLSINKEQAETVMREKDLAAIRRINVLAEDYSIVGRNDEGIIKLPIQHVDEIPENPVDGTLYLINEYDYGEGRFNEAQSDGKQYARQDKQWSEIEKN